jgi:hypothetical protein
MRKILALFAIAVVLSAQAARNTREFELFKRPQPTQVGEIGLLLKGTDVKKQRFSLNLVVDGHTIEKNDLDIQIPLFVYVGRDSEPHELVVTKVAADQITGRLVSPK